MVRLGLGLYGLGTYDGIDRLEEVLAWKCTVSQVGVLQTPIGWAFETIEVKPIMLLSYPRKKLAQCIKLL